jgi:hypothetical protein
MGQSWDSCSTSQSDQPRAVIPSGAEGRGLRQLRWRGGGDLALDVGSVCHRRHAFARPRVRRTATYLAQDVSPGIGITRFSTALPEATRNARQILML